MHTHIIRAYTRFRIVIISQRRYTHAIHIRRFSLKEGRRFCGGSTHTRHYNICTRAVCARPTWRARADTRRCHVLSALEMCRVPPSACLQIRSDAAYCQSQRRACIFIMENITRERFSDVCREILKRIR